MFAANGKYGSNKPLNPNLFMNSNSDQLTHQQGASIRLMKPIDREKNVVAVIVTFVNGSSYDHLFTTVEQQAEEGTQVLVYSASSSSVG